MHVLFTYLRWSDPVSEHWCMLRRGIARLSATAVAIMSNVP